MVSSQHLPSTAGSNPECLELKDERSPRRMKALRAFVAVSALGWLAFAVLVSASTPEPPAPDVDASLALGEAGALRMAPPSAPLPPAEQVIVVSQDTSAQ